MTVGALTELICHLGDLTVVVTRTHPRKYTQLAKKVTLFLTASI